MNLDLDAIRKDIDCWANYDRQYGPSHTDADRLAVHARTLLAGVRRLREERKVAVAIMEALYAWGEPPTMPQDKALWDEAMSSARAFCDKEDAP